LPLWSTILRRLSAQEESVLRLLFGIGALPYSRDALGSRLGMSRRQLHQVELRALRRLRNGL
jgi:DNA-directed RNA polymerase sigma subunit (sigma70/sigma32)